MKTEILNCISKQKKIKLTKRQNEWLLSNTSFFDSNINLPARIWALRNDIHKKPTCIECGVYTKWIKEDKCFKDKCTKCIRKSVESKEKRKCTNLERYGVENVFQSEDHNEKAKKAKLERYGDENYNNRDAYKETCITKMGGIGFQVDHITERSKETKLERYGDENYNNRDGYKATCIKNYGVDHYWKSFDSWKSRLRNDNGLTDIQLEEIYNLLNSEEWLTDIFKEKSLYEIANLLGITYKPVLSKLLSVGLIERDEFRSILEQDWFTFLSNITDSEIKVNGRSHIAPLELDFYLPNFGIAIELDGIYWHSDNSGKDKSYHLNKTLLCQKNGTRLFHIFENELMEERTISIWKSIITNAVNENREIIYARKCKIREVTYKDSINFLEANHLQGSYTGVYNYGLYYEDELVSLMTFCKSRFNKKYDYELLRFCNKKFTSVVGGASKLFKHFLREYSGSIISYADMRYSAGNLYKQLGFEYSHSSSPNYYYFTNNSYKLHSRQKFQKHKLQKLVECGELSIFNPLLSESQNMKLNGWNRIFDCGNQVWIYNK